GRSLTGRPLGRWVDDRAVTAAVKSELASLNASPRTRISVDTYDGIVYLSGIVDDEEGKRQAQSRARSVAHVEQVVVNVQVQNGASPGAASPRTDRQSGAIAAS